MTFHNRGWDSNMQLDAELAGHKAGEFLPSSKRKALRAASALTPAVSLTALVIAGMIGVSSPAYAANLNWTGTNGTNWLDGANWDSGTAPTSADSAYTNGTVVLSGSAQASRLYVQSGTLTIDGALTTSSSQFFYGGTAIIDGTSTGQRFSIGGQGAAVSVYGNGTLTITGTAATSNVLLRSGSLISAGRPGEVGTLTIDVANPTTTSSLYALQFQEGATYQVEVGSTAADAINVAGTVEIATGANLQIVSFGSPATYASSYTILSGTSINGTFSNVTLASELQAAGFEVAYSSTAITLVKETTATEAPTQAPTQAPTEAPTQAPTEAPTAGPTEAPTQAPTEAPTQAPTEAPTEAPTQAPTEAPTQAPTQAPTEAPTQAPTEAPTQAPTEAPTQAPTEAPTDPLDGAANTPNQSAVASALQSSGAPGDLLTSVLGLSGDARGQALQALSGEAHASSQSALVQGSLAVNSAINSRIRSVSGGVGTAPPPVLGYAEEQKTGPKDDRFASYEKKAENFDDERFGVWGSGFGSWGKIDGVNGGFATDIATGGFIVGADGLLTDNVRAGVYAGYSRSSFDTDISESQSDNYHIGAYAGSQIGAVSLRSGIGYTWHKLDTQRVVSALGQTLTGDYDAGSFNAFGELGYRFDIGKSAFEPFVNLAHTSMKTDGFTEAGGSAALTVDGQTINTTFTTLGLRASTTFDIDGVLATARGTVGWRHAFGDVDPVSMARFAGGDAFSTSGTPIDKNAALFEAGLDFAVSPKATFGVTYTGQVGSNAYEHGVNAKLRVNF